MNRLIMFGLPIIFLAALFVLFATQIGRDTSFVPSVLINKPAPEFTLAAIENYQAQNQGFSTSDLQGQVSVVNIFASWCIPCRAEHALLVALKEQHPEISLFGINQKDQPEQAISFLNELGDPYDAIGADANGRVSIEWGVYGVPETFVINAEGTITYKHIGPISADTLENSVLPAIAAAKL